MFIILIVKQTFDKMANYGTLKHVVNLSGRSCGHIAAFDGVNVEFDLGPCFMCKLKITTGYFCKNLCNCGEFGIMDYTGYYTGGEITKFCSFLELGSIYNVSFAYYFDSTYIPHKLTNLFNIVKTGDSDNDDQTWTFIGQ